jgi:hypothetical protein
MTNEQASEPTSDRGSATATTPSGDRRGADGMPPVAIEAVRALQRLIRVVNAARSRLERWLGKPGTRWYVMLCIALVALLVTCFRNDTQDAMLELSTGRISFIARPRGEETTLEFGLGAIRLTRFVLRGAELVSPQVPGAEPEESPVFDIRSESADAGARAGSIQRISFPVHSTVEISTSESGVALAIRPPQGVGGPISVVFNAERGSRVGLEGVPDTLQRFPDDPRLLTFQSSGADGLEIVGRLPDAPQTRVQLGSYGFRATDVDVLAPLTPERRLARSALLGGLLTFPELPRRDAERLWIGERVMADRFDGTILQIQHVPGSPDADSIAEAHLHVTWRGMIEGLRIGHPGGLRDARPTLLEAWLGGRGVADYVALATALIAFVSLLLPRAERDAEKAEQAQKKVSTLGGKSNEEP